jgi:hypothetical protein
MGKFPNLAYMLRIFISSGVTCSHIAFRMKKFPNLAYMLRISSRGNWFPAT